MRVRLFLDGDLKVFLPGAGLALAAGILLGGAMQPQLYDGDRPGGPQMVADFAGERSTGPFDPGTTFAAYHGNVPDYVLGTDWKKSMAWPPEERAAVSAAAVSRDDPAPTQDQTPVLTRTAYVEPAAPPHVYPSLSGAGPSVHAATDADVAADDDNLPADQG
ncbi:MAG: hypothetical protein ACXU8S_13735 [Phenylobacterium sp.]